MHLRSHAALESNINVTPLVDVCLVLLIIFMVIVPTIVNGVPVRLPTATGEPVPSESQLAITVKDDGTVYLGSVVVRSEQVSSELQRLHAQSPGRRSPFGGISVSPTAKSSRCSMPAGPPVTAMSG